MGSGAPPSCLTAIALMCPSAKADKTPGQKLSQQIAVRYMGSLLSTIVRPKTIGRLRIISRFHSAALTATNLNPEPLATRRVNGTTRGIAN